METRTLDDAVDAGEPLIDLEVCFREGIDYAKATKLLNSLGDDIQFQEIDWYNDPRLRIGQATAEGVFRHFGAKVTRVNLERWDSDKQVYDGVWDDAFRWSDTEIRSRPDSLSGLIEEVGITQPGANDEAQGYTPMTEQAEDTNPPPLRS